MIGAFKSCGTGARVLRSTSGATLESNGLRDYNKMLEKSPLNWSQRRFLRQGPPSNIGQGNPNARFVIKEIESQIMKQNCDLASEQNAMSLGMEKELRKYSRSLRDHQSLLLETIKNNEKNRSVELIEEISKLITGEGAPIVRVKSRKNETFLKEWIGVQKELRLIRRDRTEDYKRRLQIAGQQALREMEANLQQASNLDELDQAIEGALCSEAKREYTQKSWHDN